MLSATFVPMMIIMGLSKYRLFFIDLLVPLNMITRGFVGIILRRRHRELDCVHPALDVAREYLGLSLFIADAYLLRSNYLISVLSFPVFGLFSISKQKDKSLINQNQCVVTIGERILASGFEFLSLVPGAYSIWSWVHYEMTTMLVYEAMRKQQHLMLEIFDRQHDGVVLLQKPAEKVRDEAQPFDLESGRSI